MDVSASLGAHSEPVPLDGPKVYHIPGWDEFGDPKRMDVITRIAKMRGHDPRIATLAVNILKEAGVPPRDYEGQAAALLNFVQTKLYYVNEPGERLSDPLRTLKVGYGDCDDLVIILGALLESIRMPWRLVISGTKGRKKVRYHHGDKFPGGEKKGYIWSHIYMAIGDRPFTPRKWRYAETTVRGAPLGWDVVKGGAAALPEMNNFGAIMSYGNYHAGGLLSKGWDKVQDAWTAVVEGVKSDIESGKTPGPGSDGSLFYSDQGFTPVVADTTVASEPGPGLSLPAPGLATYDIATPSFMTGTPGISTIPGLHVPSLDLPTVSKGWDPGGSRRRHFARRRPAGQVSRRAVPASTQTADMVAVVVIRPDGKVLALHRASHVKWMPGRWDLPGGKVNRRPARAAAVRLLAL